MEASAMAKRVEILTSDLRIDEETRVFLSPTLDNARLFGRTLTFRGENCWRWPDTFVNVALTLETFP